MSAEMSTTIVVTPEGKKVNSLDVQEGKHHCLPAETNPNNGDVILNFSTRRTMYDFAVSVLREAVYGTSAQQKFYPLGADGNGLVVNGVRMSEDSAGLFVFYGSSPNVSTS